MKYSVNKNISYIKRLRSLVSMIPILMILFTLSSCNKELDVKTDFPFEFQVMPVPKSIAKGETVTIRCTIKTEGNYQRTKYYIRYFQFEGAGKLLLANANSNINSKMLTLKPNDSYVLPEQQFRLLYVSEGNSSHEFDVWISNNHGHEQKVSFQFNTKTKED
ncbi:DUF3872 domain-containing protein [Chryseobacterium viscerum]|nr:DUF3872 domain-containing protein [Chryseobacterium viscerum]